MRRIVVLSSTPPSPTEGSGTFVATDALVHGLRDLGHDVRVVPLRVRTRVHTLDRWLYNAAAALRAPAADLVIGIDLDGFLWALRRDVPFIAALKGIIADEATHERGWVRVLLSVQARWERRNARRADRIVVPSRYSADVAQRVYDVPPAKVTVIPEPIDLSAWRARLTRVPEPGPRPPTVLTVARMYPRKRMTDLLEAAVLLRERIPGVRLRVVGQGPEYARVRDLRARLDLGGTVDLLGDVSAERLAVEYGGADCFCLPSVQEAFGIVLAEAMAAGLPVVACRAAAVPEVVPDERAGFLVPPRRPAALAGALATLLEDRELRMEMGMAGRTYVERFDIGAVARRWIAVLTS